MENSLENKKVEIGQEALGYLETTRKWTMFLAILGFIGIGLILLFGLLFGTLIGSLTSKMSGMSGMEGFDGMNSVRATGGFVSILFFLFYLIIAVIWFFPMLYLLKFSQHSKRAVATCDPNEMTLAFRNIKSFWKYLGILYIIVIAVFIIIIILAGASMAFLSHIG